MDAAWRTGSALTAPPTHMCTHPTHTHNNDRLLEWIAARCDNRMAYYIMCVPHDMDNLNVASTVDGRERLGGNRHLPIGCLRLRYRLLLIGWLHCCWSCRV